jgi:pimeloyl-ACP methyl ester carboxylesterase
VPAPTPVEQGSVQVGDRRVGFRWYGAARSPSRPVVVSCHGGLSCGADAALAHGPAVDRDVSVLAVDRPGIATSDGLPGWTAVDASGDVVAVLDEAHVDAASVVGWSLGGQYALALAALRPDRVARCAVVAGVPPLSWPGVRSALSAVDRRLLRAVERPWPAFGRRAFVHLVHRQARRSLAHRRADGSGEPGRLERRTWGDSDLRALATAAGALIDGAVVEATASNAGVQEEYRAWGRPWGFELAAMTTPTAVWQGDQDRLVPEELGRRLAASIPGATFRPCPGLGHLLLVDRWGDVLDDVLGAA